MRMQQLISVSALAVFLALAASGPPGDVPVSVAGFTLGRPIAEAASRVIMETELPVRYMEYLHEVEIIPTRGFKSGLIAFGVCRQPPTIARIKLKYEDDSVEFFDELLKRFKQKFGDSAEYQGDPFKVFISWKWSFADAYGNRISLTLQHNLQDEEEKIGNAVKMTLHNRLEADSSCFKENRMEQREALRQRRVPTGGSSETDWDRFVPR